MNCGGLDFMRHSNGEVAKQTRTCVARCEPVCADHARSSRKALRFCWLIVGFFLLANTGCRSRNTNKFVARSMPDSLRIAARMNPQEVDLSRLASSGASSEVIGPGDVLEVTIAAGLDVNDTVTMPVRVTERGSIELPDIGSVQVAGLEPAGADAAIRTACINQDLYRNPQITTVMKRQRTYSVRVLGAVKKPGTYSLPPGQSDLLSAIVMAEGLAEDASEVVEIRNPIHFGGMTPDSFSNPSIAGMGEIDQVSHTTGYSGVRPKTVGKMVSKSVNLVNAARGMNSDYSIRDGGVVMVQKRRPQPIQVIGLVNKPGEYDFPAGRDVRVLGALSLAGGVKNQLANKIFVIRPLADQPNPAVIQVSIREAKKNGRENIRLAPGDVVSVEQTPGTVLMDALQIIRFGVNGSLSTLF